MDRVRKEAHKIINNVLKNNYRSEKLLEKTVNKFNDDKERALLYHLVKGVLKMLYNIEYIASRLCDENKLSKTSLKIKVLLYLGLYQLIYCKDIPAYHSLNETVELAKSLYDKKVADFINAVLREYQRNPDVEYPSGLVDYLAAKYSYPPDLISRWLRLWGEQETEKLCRYCNEVPKLAVRINRMATSKKRLINYFRRKNIRMEEVDLSDNILVTEQAKECLGDVSFSEGYYSVQDPAAAMTVELLAPQPDENVLDLFAGPGGKCTYISEIMQNTGEVVAVDRYPQKIKKVKQALHRLQITNTITVVEDALKYGPKAPAYDRVLLDVPCSGWGVLQKKPELRWQSLQDMKSLLKLQENALNTGAQFVKPGGVLLYSTCTMNPQENEEQVARFLDSRKDFQAIDAAKFIPSRYTNKGFMLTLPQRNRVDGAFAVKMVRDR